MVLFSKDGQMTTVVCERNFLRICKFTNFCGNMTICWLIQYLSLLLFSTVLVVVWWIHRTTTWRPGTVPCDLIFVNWILVTKKIVMSQKKIFDTRNLKDSTCVSWNHRSSLVLDQWVCSSKLFLEGKNRLKFFLYCNGKNTSPKKCSTVFFSGFQLHQN